MKYLLPFLGSFLLTVILTFLALVLSKKIKWSRRESERHIHNKNVSRLGGLIMVVASSAAILWDRNLVMTSELYGFVFGMLILLIAGFKDDLQEIFWKIQLFIQIAVAVLIFIMGIRIYYVTNPLTGGVINLDMGLGIIFSVMLVIFWIVLVINAINWADGVDGLSGGITFIALSTIFLLIFRPEVNQPPIGIICAILMGTVLGFLLFNFYPSKIIAGTAGSMFMGFSLSVLAIFSGTKIATALMVLSIPIIDFLWVILERVRNKKSIFLPDNNHLHHKLMKLGWSQRKIVLVYLSTTAVIAIVALNTRAIGKGISFLVVAVIMVSILLFLDKRVTRAKLNA